jgi:hypothetical protein
VTENYIQVPPNSSGEKVRAFKNTIGLNDVSSEAVTLTDAAGNVMGNFVSGRLDVYLGASGITLPVSSTQLPSALVGGRLDVVVGAALPAGTNNIGDVDVLTLPSLPSGTNNIGDVDVLTLPSLPAGSNSIGTLGTNTGVDIGDVTVNNGAGAAAVNIQDGGNSITVDGTVTANAGTNLNTSALALDATLSAMSLVDHTAFTQGTTLVSPNGYIFDEVAGTPLNENDIAAARVDVKRAIVHVLEDATTRGQRAAVSSVGAVRVDGSFTTQPVSGTVTANAGTNLNTSALALSATQTDGTQKSIVRGGVKGATAAADVTSTSIDANHNALDVSVKGTVTLATGSLEIGTVDQGTGGTSAWKVDGSAVTQPVSGTVTANAGTNLNTSLLALDSTLTGGTQTSRVTDGTNTATVKAASTAAVAADKALVVAISPNNSVAVTGALTDTQLRATAVPVSGPLTDTQLRATAVPVSGTVTANAGTGPWPVTDNAGSLTVDAPVGTPLFARLSDGTTALTTTGGRLAVDGSGVTQPVSIAATVTVTDTSTLVDNAAFTDGTTRVGMAGFIFDEVAGTALTENDAAAARINANRAQIGVIEDGATRARYATVTAANALKVDGSAVTQPVSGTVTANAGTGTFAVSGPLTDTQLRATAVPVSGTVTANAGTGPWPVTDNAGSLTVDAPVGTPLFARLSDGTTALTTTGGRLAVDGSGVTQPVSIAATVTVSDTCTLVDNAGFTDGTTRVSMMGYIFDEVAGTALTENDAAAARIDSKRAVIHVIEDATTRGQRATVSAAGAVKVDGSAVIQPSSQSGTWTVQPGNTANTTPWLTTNTPATSGGYSISKTITAASTNATNVKASAGQLYGYYIYNDSNATRYVKLHNTAGVPTAGSGVVMTIGIPSGSAANVEFANGIAFSTGIAFTTVTGIADANASAVGASDLAINLLYK